MSDKSELLYEDCVNAAQGFGVQVKKIRKEIALAGSPDRSAFRTAVQDTKDHIYVLESVFVQDIHRKEQIADTLARLAENQLEKVNPYLPTSDRKYLLHSQGKYWLMSAYVDGISLERSDYAFDQWRGQCFADFLLCLQKSSEALFTEANGSFFSIVSYIQKIMADMEKNDPEYLSGFLCFFEKLEKSFFCCHDQLPRRFCHGDFHPMNMIWGRSQIRAVIDWEFSGIKPEAYDLANLLGCLGMEHPHALTGKLVLACVQTLKEKQFLVSESWETLLDFVLAIRFAWLAEWLRRKDVQMIEMERAYMKILCDNAHDLKEIWGI